MELSADVLELLRKDEEFLLYRDKPSSVLRLAPVSTRPALESLRKIEHEYSLKDKLDPAWVVRPLALSQQHRQTTLVLEDPGETLDCLLPGPLEMTQFLRFAVGLAASLGGLHKKDLIASSAISLKESGSRIKDKLLASERSLHELTETIPGVPRRTAR